jgi:hypothetical protein
MGRLFIDGSPIKSDDGGMSEEAGDGSVARWRRRESRRQAERRRMKKHGAGLGSAYRSAVLKRAASLKPKRRKRPS